MSNLSLEIKRFLKPCDSGTAFPEEQWGKNLTSLTKDLD